ncbi:hypothetical protein GIB67_017110 [Kingdonia uniflora]|uniref:Uncharacterized protein n=1 Tax=Kingdonia uniflora TaxID=39325 RepID=A0A7J7NCN0_9MAGN|nr:hypothetical protein GIB67_017110 [Kingdonia uniflora]
MEDYEQFGYFDSVCNYQIEERKQAAADVLFSYSQFAMVCIGERVRPCDLRLHLMKELSGMPTSLKGDDLSELSASPDEMTELSTPPDALATPSSSKPRNKMFQRPKPTN